jgi:hypothetical protein
MAFNAYNLTGNASCDMSGNATFVTPKATNCPAPAPSLVVAAGGAIASASATGTGSAGSGTTGGAGSGSTATGTASGTSTHPAGNSTSPKSSAGNVYLNPVSWSGPGLSLYVLGLVALGGAAFLL